MKNLRTPTFFLYYKHPSRNVQAIKATEARSIVRILLLIISFIAKCCAYVKWSRKLVFLALIYFNSRYRAAIQNANALEWIFVIHCCNKCDFRVHCIDTNKKKCEWVQQQIHATNQCTSIINSVARTVFAERERTNQRALRFTWSYANGLW